MSKRIYFLFFILFNICFLSLQAQHRDSLKLYSQEASAVLKKYKNRLSWDAAKKESTTIDMSEVMMSPYMFKLIGPGIYYSSALKENLGVDYALPGASSSVETSALMNYRSVLNSEIDETLLKAYVDNPSAFRYYDSQVESEDLVTSEPVVNAKPDDLEAIYQKTTEIKDVAEVVDDVEVEIQIEKPNFWTTSGQFKFQFLQNYVSENWWRGENNNVDLFTQLTLNANYNNQKGVTWENSLDMRLGFVTASSDSIHRFLTNNDKIRLFSKLGIRAIKNWNYTLSTEATTQFLPSYRSNDRRTFSNFLSPLDVFVSLGVDFKPSLKNGNTFSAAILPLTYKIRYIGDDDETIHNSYNMRGEDFQQDFGSKVEVNTKLTIVKNLTWKSRFYFFTTHEYVESEFENTFSFQFNKYISCDVYTIWRFDDNRDKRYYDSTLGYFQFKEYFKLGLNYGF